MVATKIDSLLSFHMFFTPMMCVLVTEINYEKEFGICVGFNIKEWTGKQTKTEMCVY